MHSSDPGLPHTSLGFHHQLHGHQPESLHWQGWKCWFNHHAGSQCLGHRIPECYSGSQRCKWSRDCWLAILTNMWSAWCPEMGLLHLHDLQSVVTEPEELHCAHRSFEPGCSNEPKSRWQDLLCLQSLMCNVFVNWCQVLYHKTHNLNAAGFNYVHMIEPAKFIDPGALSF